MADETPQHVAHVTGYALDKYEVTVGRMRRFVQAYDKSGLVGLLSQGAGAHPLINSSEWDPSWDSLLPDDADGVAAALSCHNDEETWTNSLADETYPINCVSWYLAYAFCAWDGGRLPTEAEWEYVAAGGDENFLYPWGADEPNDSLANYLDSDNTPHLDVFAKPAGAGRWGHQGLAGSLWEWALDRHDPTWYTSGSCQDCANLAASGPRTQRGGDWHYHAHDMRAAERLAGGPTAFWPGSGVRCARD